MRRPQALTAAGAPAPTMDFSQMGHPYKVAYAHFLSMVADATTNATSATGYVRAQAQSLATADDLIPAEWTILADWDVGERIIVAGNDGDLLYCQTEPDGAYVSVEVFSPSGRTAAQTIIAAIMGHCPPIDAPELGLSARFWYMTSMGPQSVRREIDAPDWTDVAGNYSLAVRQKIEAIAAWRTAPPSGGRLLLAHGPPGTGKSWALSTLAREWSDWADVHVVSDPDEFFAHSSYMFQVMLDSDEYYPYVGTAEPVKKWRLIVVEDCDEILSQDARDRSGHAVSKLLNVADGMLGRGLRTLLLLTTNETVDNFHEAIIRPGRCLGNIFFGPLPADEADAWRTARGLATTGETATLAALYEQERATRKDRAATLGRQIREATSNL